MLWLHALEKTAAAFFEAEELDDRELFLKLQLRDHWPTSRAERGRYARRLAVAPLCCGDGWAELKLPGDQLGRIASPTVVPYTHFSTSDMINSGDGVNAAGEIEVWTAIATFLKAIAFARKDGRAAHGLQYHHRLSLATAWADRSPAHLVRLLMLACVVQHREPV